jgi:hypothetical protein
MNVRSKPLRTVLAGTALLLLSAGSAFAQEATHEYDRPPVMQTGVTRAQVVADTAAFRASGELPSFSSKLNVTPVRFKSPQNRAEVKAETMRALKAHEVTSQGELYSVAQSRPQQIAQR